LALASFSPEIASKERRMPRHSAYQQGAMVTRKDEERRHDAIIVALAIAVAIGIVGVGYALVT
jgi:hypothetical protein